MFVCTHCDAQSLKWSGKCATCDKWGTLVEEVTEANVSLTKNRELHVKPAQSRSLEELPAQKESDRLKTSDLEIDRVLGGGIVAGSLILLSGEPGIGKSTLVAQIASAVSSSVLYISGEESQTQLAARFKRLDLNTKSIRFLEVVPIETLVATIEKEQPTLAIIDSVQTLTSALIESTAGSPTLVRYATSLLLELAKRTHVSILLVGQVTKDGSIAGPKTLEHLVDVVVNLEGDPVHSYRMLRANKNRFGATDEIGVFEMTAQGLKAVANPSERFLAERSHTPGSVIAATIEGSRVFLVEVQALVEKSVYGTPVRRASGFDPNRLQMLLAILSKRAGLRLGEQDVYVNVIGGMQLTEPAADLAVAAAIVSAYKNATEETTSVYMGEIGLGGEVRSVPMLEKRLQETSRLGIARAIIPAKSKIKMHTLELQKIENVSNLST